MHLPRWSLSSSSSSSSPLPSPSPNNNRRLTRAKQLRHLRDFDLSTLLTSPPRHPNNNGDFSWSSSSPSPQPLPSPPNKFKSKKRGSYDSFRLPSPVEINGKNITEQKSRKSQGNNKLTVDVKFRSAPQTPMMMSPERVSNGDPFLMYYPMDSTRIYSRKSVSGPTSPINNRFSVENNNNNVYPLPLPPTPSVMGLKNQWIKGKLIGRGTFGSVFVATHRETGALCAMKEVDLLPDDPKCAECMRQLQQEIKVLSHLKHPNIVQYYGSEIVDDKFYIYLEYVYPGSINKYINEHSGSINEVVVRNFTRHILSGLAYLHSRKTIHRDIKGANLLVDACGVVKLADFGMAKHLTGQTGALSSKGSPYWMAPELIQAVMHKENSSDMALAVDIWSLGCTIIEMLTGKTPWSEFEGAAAMFKVLKESPPIPETLSWQGKDFLRCCFQRDPADRPPASKLLEHPFLRTSQQLDFPSPSNLAPNFMNQMDKVAHSPGEMHDHKHEKVPLSPNWTANGRGYSNESAQISHLESFDFNMSSRRSPRSILEPATCTSLRSASNRNAWCLQMS